MCYDFKFFLKVFMSMTNFQCVFEALSAEVHEKIEAAKNAGFGFGMTN